MSAPLSLDVAVEPPWAEDERWDALAERAAAAAARVAPELANPRLAASVVFTADAEVRALNARWRGKDAPTNVLSFPMLTRAELLALAPQGSPVLLGDVTLAHETCAREAGAKRLALADHAAHLIVHGLLHLAGYDHETSDGDAAAMEALETKALALMGIADPYCDGHEAAGA